MQRAGAGRGAPQDASSGAATGRRGRLGLLLTLALAAHVALVLYAYPLRVVFGELPLGTPDYQTHYHQISTLLAAPPGLGRLWVYDPGLLAGFPTGLVFDVDNKAYFLFVRALTGLGLSTPVAFNLFPVVVAALAPACLWLAARALALPAAAQLTAYALGVLLWHMDPTAHFCWIGGMISFAACSALAMPVLALFARLLQDDLHPRARERDAPTRAGARARFAALLVGLPLALLLHAWAFAILAAPMIAVYLRRARSLSRAGHARVWALAAAALAANLYWLIPALAHLELITPSAAVGQATPAYLLSDLVERVINEVNTGPLEQHTLWRFAALLSAGAGLLAWRRAGASARWRLEIAALALAWLGFLTYFGALVPGLSATEPYRFAIPMTLWAGVIAAPWLARQLSPSSLRAAGREARVVLLAIAALLSARVAHELLYYLPELARVQRAPAPGERPDIGSSFRAQEVSIEFRYVATHLEHTATPVGPGEAPGRVLVQWWPLAEYLAWSTELPIIGGFPDRRLVFETSNLYHRGFADPRRRDGELAAYLARYNIHYVITSPPPDPLMHARSDLLEPGPALPGMYQVFRVRSPSTYFAAGRGRVRTALGRVDVWDAVPDPERGELILKFHYMPELVCTPDCALEPAPVDDSSAAFIRVRGQPSPPRAFTIADGGAVLEPRASG